MGLPRRIQVGSIGEKVEVNVYNIHTKQIVFTGGQQEAADFLGIQIGHLRSGLITKHRIKKQFAVRLKSDAKTT